MNKSDILELEITDLTSEGRGIGHFEGMAVFVAGSIPGDLVKISVNKVSRNFAEGRIIKLLVPSADRIEPPCTVAHKCGGCSLQFMSYEAQIKWKQQKVLESMVRVGGFDRDIISVVMRDILGAEDVFRYRNKVQMPVGGGSVSPHIGFYEYNSHTIVDADICLVQHEFADKVRCLFREAVVEGLIEPYDETSGKGLLRHLMVRVGFGTNQAMIVAVLSRKESTGIGLIRDRLLALANSDNVKLTALYVNVNPSVGNTVLGKEFDLISGSGYIEEKLHGLTFRVSPSAFFQVNTSMASRLFTEVLDLASLKAYEHAVDLYCGTGSISLLLAKECAKVIGIEIVEQAITDAEINAEINGVRNVEFHTGRSEILLPRFVADGLKADLVVLDPPRKGAERAVLDAILETAPSRIVYVSCEPATLARDCKILCAGGKYRVSAVRPVDLFPWTSHVESVVLMSRNDSMKS